MLEVYCSEEIKRGSRIVYQNADWVVVVPYWATWPYQLLLLPKFNIKKMAQLNPGPVQKKLKSFTGPPINWNFSFMGYHKDPDGEIENSGKSIFKIRISNFHYSKFLLVYR